MAVVEAGKKAKRILTRDKLIGMQVINSEGYIVGKVKELSLVLGETDQALILQDDDGKEDIFRWSDVMAAGDVVLLKPQNVNTSTAGPATGSSPDPLSNCPKCGAALDTGTLFCTSCGYRLNK